MKESILQKQILAEFGALPWLRLCRNNTGQAWTGNKIIKIDHPREIKVTPGDVVIQRAHPIKFGVEGSSDLIGISAPNGQWVSIENKSETGEQSDIQKKYQKMITSMGGIYILARSVEDVYRGLNLKE